MTPEQFKAWRKRMGYTQAAAAEALGVYKATIGNYEKGERREGGSVTIPKPIALACMALAAGITDYVEPEG